MSTPALPTCEMLPGIPCPPSALRWVPILSPCGRDSSSLSRCLPAPRAFPKSAHYAGARDTCLGSALFMCLSCFQTWDGSPLPLGKVCGPNASWPPLHGDRLEFLNTLGLPCFPAFALAVCLKCLSSSF